MSAPHRLAAVLFDRDGTLVVDVPYCADPARVQPLPTARPALRRLRAAGIRTGVVTNQSGIGRGLLTATAAAAVNAEVDRLLGPFDVWQVCPHAPEDGCRCRKPRPGMLLAAAAALRLEPHNLAFVGDIGSDVDAARAAGLDEQACVLVPTAVTRPDEIRAAPVVRRTLLDAVDHLLATASDRSASDRDAKATA
jgi:D-glycero-D-manno-heptose 1,7-bisphosphate phosphatase